MKGGKKMPMKGGKHMMPEKDMMHRNGKPPKQPPKKQRKGKR